MTAGTISFCSDVFDPVRLVGPIFDKELRVSSRRRRNHLLRFAYVAVLGILVLSTWHSFVGTISSVGSVAATIGLYFSIVWFFCGWFNSVNRFFFTRLLSGGGGQWLFFGMAIIRTLTIGGAGLAFARCARRRIRRDIF